MLPPGTAEGAAPVSAEVHASVAAVIVQQLSDEGVQVLSAEEAARQMVAQPYAGCNAVECGATVVRGIGVDFAVLVTIWAGDDGPRSVVVTIITERGSYAGDAPVRDDLAGAAARAIGAALQGWQDAELGTLDLDTAPPGAAVQVDGNAVGHTPLSRGYVPGEHQLRLTLRGFRPVERNFTIARSETETLRIDLARIQTTPRREEPSVWNFVIGGGLAAVGVGLLIPPMHGLAVDGTCVEEMPCTHIYQFGVANGVLLGAAVASLATGLFFLIGQPLQVTVEVSPSSAQLRILGTL